MKILWVAPQFLLSIRLQTTTYVNKPCSQSFDDFVTKLEMLILNYIQPKKLEKNDFRVDVINN